MEERWVRDRSGGTAITTNTSLQDKWNTIKEWIGKYTENIDIEEVQHEDPQHDTIQEFGNKEGPFQTRKRHMEIQDPSWSKRLRLTALKLKRKHTTKNTLLHRKKQKYTYKMGNGRSDENLLVDFRNMILPQMYFDQNINTNSSGGS